MGQEWKLLDVGHAGEWAFVGGPWQRDGEGLMRPPTEVVDENLAVYTPHHFGELEAEFDFRWTNVCCGGGVLFSGRHARDYYLIEFPCTGQLYRAEHFHVCISKVDERGWAKALDTQFVHGVPSEIGLWHKCRLVVQDRQIRLWVDGRPLAVVHDDGCGGPGHFGLYSYDGLGGKSPLDFRDVRVRGEAHGGSIWDAAVEPSRNWYYPTTEQTYGSVLHHESFTRAPGGDLLMKLSTGDEYHGREYTPVMIRSSDKGKAWSPMQKLPDEMRRALLFTTRGGGLMMFRMDGQPPFDIARATSSDDGHTWSPFESCGRVAFASDVDMVAANHLIELDDGTLLWSMYRRSTDPPEKQAGRPYWSYCIRSTDGGKTWSAPVDFDGEKPEGFERFMMVPKSVGSETSLAQTRGGRVLALVREDPVMWESWSNDGGQTWTPASRGAFGMWACTHAMCRTECGALIVAGRHPGLAFQISYDDGITWDCYRFDTTFWANGCAWEIEPNLVMYASTAKYGDPRVRVHLFRITAQGPQPAQPG